MLTPYPAVPSEVKKCGSYPGPGDVAERQLVMNPARQFIGSDEPHMTQMFDNFKKTHKKGYANKVEHERRKNIFRHNVRWVGYIWLSGGVGNLQAVKLKQMIG